MNGKKDSQQFFNQLKGKKKKKKERKKEKKRKEQKKVRGCSEKKRSSMNQGGRKWTDIPGSDAYVTILM